MTFASIFTRNKLYEKKITIKNINKYIPLINAGETFITDNIILIHFSLNGEIYFLLLILKKNCFNITINVQN
jgi:hypothetical protein